MRKSAAADNAVFVICGLVLWRSFCAAPAEAAAEERATSVAANKQAEPTTATSVPRFDIWAKQPHLGFCLPAIRSWEVVRHVDARVQLPRSSDEPTSPDFILVQRPFGEAGLSKYSVIFQPLANDLTQSDVWYQEVGARCNAFTSALRTDKRFGKIEISSPTLTGSGDLRRFYVSYRLEKSSGEAVSGAFLGVPVRRGLLIFALTLDGHEPQTVAEVMRRLRGAVTRGLAMRTWSPTPYVVGALLAAAALAIGVIAVRQLRKTGLQEKQR